jgi:hypothetical protein
MASNTKKAKAVRKWKKKPQKANLKADKRRIEKNRAILAQLATEEQGSPSKS